MGVQCPLCTSLESIQYCRTNYRDYIKCPQCQSIFVSSDYHLNNADAKIHYDQHENDDTQTGYINYLNQLRQPLLSLVQPDSKGLDYGSGPNPVFSNLLNRDGHSMTSYDPIYSHVPIYELPCVDFTILSEVVEHFTHPQIEWQRILRHTRRNGYIGVLTQCWDKARTTFDQWHYQRDPTHVHFYSTDTWQYMARTFSLTCVYNQNPAFIFQKN